ncbi:MAG: DUF11 domain-containing protein [Acidobacteria bacterium]|nr:DUF11 domain-containing protein [Acidobacteriota bacterium]
MTWTVGTLAVGVTVTVTFDATVVAGTAAGTVIFNQGQLTSPDLTQPVDTNVTEHFVKAAPGIDVVKTPDIGDSPQPLSKAVNDTVVFTYEVTNGGDVSLKNVVLSDNLEGSPTFASGDTGNDGILELGETWIYTATHTVTQPDIDAGVIGTNVDGDSGTATATGDAVNGSGSTEATDPGGVTLVQTPGIAVEKKVNGVDGPITLADAHEGDTVEYTYTVTNTGNVTLINVTLSDNVEGSIELFGLTDEDGDSVSDDLAPGASATGSATHSLTQPEIDAGSVTNTATATGIDPSGGTQQGQDDETVNLTRNPAIEVVKSASPNSGLVVGDDIDYKFTVTNTGNVTLINVTLDDDVLGSITLSGLTDEDGDNDEDDLAPGAEATGSATHEVTQADVDSGTLTNVATAEGTPPSGPRVDDDDQVEIPFVNLSVTKTSVVTPVMLNLTNAVAIFSSNGNEPGASITDKLCCGPRSTTRSR